MEGPTYFMRQLINFLGLLMNIKSTTTIHFLISYYALLAYFSLAATDAVCKENGPYMGYVGGLGACAFACKDHGMFVYGKNESNQCENGQCTCYCQEKTDGHNCDITPDDKYNLYAFNHDEPGMVFHLAFTSILQMGINI